MFRQRPHVSLLIATLVSAMLMLSLIPASAQSDVPEGLELIGSTDSAFSIYVPTGWVFETMEPNPAYPTTLLAAENTALLADLEAYQLAEPTSRMSTGSFAIIASLSPALWQQYAANAEEGAILTMQAIGQSTPVFNQFSIEIGPAGYTATVIETSTAELNARGYIGAFAHDGALYVFQLMSAPVASFQNNMQLLETIGASISVPAEAGALTRPTDVQPTAVPTEEAVVTPEVAVTDESGAALFQIDAADGVLSIVLPDLWFYQDRTGDENLFVYGNTEAAVDSRLYALRPDAFTAPVTMSGIGGVIEFYSLSDFGLSADNADVAPLMTQVLDGLTQQGYEIVEEPTAFELNGFAGQIAVIRGSEYGFLALVPFEEQLGYITATGTDADFDANRDTLLSILESIHVPAAAPEPTATPAAGLGGLGNLRNTDATATPAAGLGGLGGLRGADATEEADVIEDVVAEATAES